jgi:hypothetical protein
MVTSRSVPQQMEQMLSARAGHSRLAFRFWQIGQINIYSWLERKIALCHSFRDGRSYCACNLHRETGVDRRETAEFGCSKRASKSAISFHFYNILARSLYVFCFQ